MKVLVFCADVLPLPGLATSGGGLRSWQWIESLREAGHEVVASMPCFTFLARRFCDRIPPAAFEDAWTPDNQEELVRRHRPQAVLFASSWITDRLTSRHDCLRIYDLNGPMLLEMQYKGERDNILNWQAKTERLNRADFVVLGGHRQRWYFAPFLLLAGHSLESIAGLPVVPISVARTMPNETRGQIEIVAGGGFYPWQDPSLALLAVADVLAKRTTPAVAMRVFGSSHSVTDDDDRRFAQLADQLRRFPNVQLHDFIPHDELLSIYRQSSFAVELHQRNPERELAITTRTIDYLRCGLPVLYNNYSELAEWIDRYDAGWTVDPANASATRQTVNEILDRPEVIAEKGKNAQRMINEHFTYARTMGPLAEFLQSPRPLVRTEPGRVLSAAAYSELSGVADDYQAMAHSRAWKAARAVSTWKRRVLGA